MESLILQHDLDGQHLRFSHDADASLLPSPFGAHLRRLQRRGHLAVRHLPRLLGPEPGDGPQAGGDSLQEVRHSHRRGNKYDPVAPPDSKDGYKDIVYAKDVTMCGRGSGSGLCWRPAGVVWNLSGTRLIMNSDAFAEGELYLISKV